MNAVSYFKDAAILVSILGLILAGFMIAIRSEPGSTAMAKGSGLLRTVFAVSCVMVVLMMAQSVVGFHVGSRW